MVPTEASRVPPIPAGPRTVLDAVERRRRSSRMRLVSFQLGFRPTDLVDVVSLWEMDSRVKMLRSGRSGPFSVKDLDFEFLNFD